MLRTPSGIHLHYLEAGEGPPVVFVHEFAGSAAAWEPQLRFLARRFRCVAYDARGYPPSDVPAQYSQELARDDLIAVIEGLGLGPAHVVGLSMGAFATLHLGLARPDLARSLTVAGVGYGAGPARARFREEIDATIALLREEGIAAFAARYAAGPARLTFRDKDPRGYAEFAAALAAHSAEGAAGTMAGVQRERPSLFDLEAGFRVFALPTLLIAGDEDDASLDATLWLKRVIPTSGLAVFPRTGHTINLEEPDLFNRTLLDFLTAVEGGAWKPRAAAPGAGIIRS